MPDIKPMVKELNVNSIMLAEFARTVHHVDIPRGTHPDDLLSPRFWKHVAKRHFRAGSRIEARWEDGSMFAELLVKSVGEQEAKVMYLLGPIDLSGAVKAVASTPMSEGGSAVSGQYYTKFKGNRYKWAVLRTDDNQTVKDGMDTEQEAIELMVKLESGQAQA